MKLFENESKALLAEYGLQRPSGEGDGYVVKAQVLAKQRAEHGGIRFADTREEAEEVAEGMRDTEVNGHRVDEVLIEPALDHDAEYYLSFTYDTDIRRPVLLFNREGGSRIEQRGADRLVLDGPAMAWRFREFLEDCGVGSEDLRPLGSTLAAAYRCFREEDALLLEVNPLARADGEYVVLDARIELDDDADYRRDRSYDDRTEFGREKTERERRAERIDEDDHRGVAGKYTELDGDIAMMLAGGGASLTNMDALIEYGGEPANYTEYGGNPPTEKVYRLSKVVLSKPGLRGCWHVGGTANNTDVHRTMKGFCEALRELEPDYPIVVRRDGPNADEGFEVLRETREDLGLEMELFRNDTPMSETAEVLMEMVP
ncbi:MAG: ATP citrate lyase citrate-binding domain-containing protein [Halobacteriales archaeon]